MNASGSAVFDTAQTDTLLTTTRSVRRRLDLGRPVDRQVIHDCVDVAMQAPMPRPLAADLTYWNGWKQPG